MEQPQTAAAPSTQGLGRRVGIAALYAILQRMLLRGLGFFSTLILVRLLAPADFGIAALASVVWSTLDMLTMTGFGFALVRMQDPQKAHYDTAFTLTALRGVVLAGLLAAAAPWQAEFMQEPKLTAVIHVIAISILIGSFVSPRLFHLQRELRFDLLLRLAVLGKLVAMAVSIPLALWLQSYWALVLGNLVAALVTVPYSYWLAPHRPRFTLAAWRDLFHFSKWVLASNLCVLADQTAMTYVVGRVQGVSAIGLYQVGQQVAMLPITELAAPMQAPFYSGFSKIYHDLKELRRQFLAAFELQWIVLLPMTAGIALTAYEVTGIFLGTRWLELVPLMPLIAFFGLADCFATNTLNIFRVLDRQARMVISWFILVGIRLLALIYATLEHGLLGATWAMLLTALLYMVVWQHQANGLLDLGPADMVRALWRGSLACLLMAAAVLAVPGDIGTWLGIPTWPMIVALLLKTLVGAVVYVGVLLLCWRLAGRPDGSGEAYVIRWGGEILGRLRWPGGRAAALPQGRPGP